MRIIGSLASLLLFAAGYWARLHYGSPVIAAGGGGGEVNVMLDRESFDDVFYVDEPIHFATPASQSRSVESATTVSSDAPALSGAPILSGAPVSSGVQTNPYLD